MWYRQFADAFGRGHSCAWPIIEETLTHDSCHSGSADRKFADWLPSRWGRPRQFLLTDEWLGSNYTRGHLASAGAHKSTQSTLQSTFTMDNMVPQAYCSNAGEWLRLEYLSRELTKWYKRVYVINGALLLPLKFRIWTLDGHRLEGHISPEDDFKRKRSSMEFPFSLPNLSFEVWKAGGAWTSRTSEEGGGGGQVGDCETDKIDDDAIHSLTRQIRSDAKATSECLQTPSSLITSFKGRTDTLNSQRLGGGQVVPTHMFKVILCMSRRRQPLVEDATTIQAPPKRMAEAFIVPNSIVPIVLPMRAFRVPIACVERLSGLNLKRYKRQGLMNCLFGGCQRFSGNHTAERDAPSDASQDLWSMLYGLQSAHFAKTVDTFLALSVKLNSKLKHHPNQHTLKRQIGFPSSV
eukprot:GHVH01008158.1.p1 GENE.GHVH01008158.1~~GHVH01008158.1.p1  ORF type:complete len:407 (+),score=43.54 GHVH01008158.1:117-1337(+)